MPMIRPLWPGRAYLIARTLTSGIIIPAPIAWIIRASTKKLKLVAIAPQMVPTKKITLKKINNRRNEKRLIK